MSLCLNSGIRSKAGNFISNSALSVCNGPVLLWLLSLTSEFWTDASLSNILMYQFESKYDHLTLDQVTTALPPEDGKPKLFGQNSDLQLKSKSPPRQFTEGDNLCPTVELKLLRYTRLTIRILTSL